MSLRFRLFVCGLVVAAASAQTMAANVTWDISPGTVGAGNSAVTGGAGAWNTANGNWTVDAGVNNIAWVNANNDTAVFGGVGGTVTLGAGITVGGLDFDITGYTVTGNTLTLGTSSIFNVDAGTATVSSIIAGVAGNTLTVTGAGTLNITNAANTFAGNIIVDGGTLRVEGSNGTTGDPLRLGSVAKTITLQNGGTYIGHTTHTNPTGTQTKQWIIGATGGTIQADAQISFDDANQFSGTGTLTKTGTGLLLIDNQAFNFSGAININAGTLTAQDNVGVLGTGSSLVTVGNSAVFDVQVNFAGVGGNTRPVTISGTGIGGNGALINSNGNATGTVNGVVTLATATTSLGGNSTLVLAQGLNGGGNTATINKVGTGFTTVSVAGTNFVGTTTVNVNAGALRGSSPSAFGTNANVVAAANSEYVQTGAALPGYAYSMNAASILGGDSTFLNSLSVGTNLNLFPTTIAQTANGANNGINIANPGTLANDASRFFGLAGDSSDSTAVGTGTPWSGISNDRVTRRWNTGTITANSNFSIRTLAGNLILGNGTTAGGLTIATSGPTTASIIGGTTQLDDDTPGYNSNLTFEVNSGASLQTVSTNSLGNSGTAANNAKVNVLSGGTLNPNPGQSLSGNVTIQPGGILQLDDNANLSGIGTITQFAGSITRINNNGGLVLSGAQSPGTVAGSIVRMETSNIASLSTKIHNAATFEVFGSDRTLVAGTAASPSMTIDGGILTNDGSSRTLRNNATQTSTINIGAGGATFVATNGTQFALNTTETTNPTSGVGLIINGGSNTLNIGVAAPTTIDGQAKGAATGVVSYGGVGNNGTPTPNGMTVGAINVLSGIFQINGGGAFYRVGGGTGDLTVNSGTTFRTLTASLIEANVKVLAGGTARAAQSTAPSYGSIEGAGNLILGGDVNTGVTPNTNTTGTTARTFTVGANNLSTTFSGVISDDNSLADAITFVKTGTGALTLSGANTYDGTTTVNAGALIAGTNAPSAAAGAFGNDASAINVGNITGTDDAALLTGGAFNIGRNVVVRAGSTGLATLGGNAASASTFSGTVTLNKNVALTQVAGGTVSFSGLIDDAAGSFTVDKVGAGVVNLSRAAGNTYDGGTTVSNGTLLVTNTSGSATGTGNVTVQSGAVLGGTGIISGTVLGAGLVSPGMSPGILTVGQIDVSGGIDFAIELSSTAAPVWSSAAASGNDVVRITNSTPLANGPLDADNHFDIYLTVVNPAIGDNYLGGLFATTDFVSDFAGAEFDYYILGDGAGTDAVFGGNSYYSLDNYNDANSSELGIDVSTVAVANANFALGTTSGFVMQFGVLNAAAVPEPRAIIVWLCVGTMAVVLACRSRRRSRVAC